MFISRGCVTENMAALQHLPSPEISFELQMIYILESKLSQICLHIFGEDYPPTLLPDSKKIMVLATPEARNVPHQTTHKSIEEIFVQLMECLINFEQTGHMKPIIQPNFQDLEPQVSQAMVNFLRRILGLQEIFHHFVTCPKFAKSVSDLEGNPLSMTWPGGIR
jgi:hypothetical protein